MKIKLLESKITKKVTMSKVLTGVFFIFLNLSTWAQSTPQSPSNLEKNISCSEESINNSDGQSQNSATADSEENSDVSIKEILSSLNELFSTKNFEEHSELHRRGQLKILTQSLKNTSSSVNKKGTGSKESQNLLNNLVFQLRYSQDLFEKTLPRNKSQLIKLINCNHKKLAHILGIDDSPNSTRIAGLCLQMKNLLCDKESVRLVMKISSDELQITDQNQVNICDKKYSAPQSENQDLNSSLLHLFAKCAAVGRVVGDVPETFRIAQEVVKRVSGQYRVFNSLQESNATFTLALEMMGLNEYLKVYSQADKFSVKKLNESQSEASKP